MAVSEIALQEGWVDAYTMAATAVLILYDHFLTFGDEVKLVWPSKKLRLRLLFYSNRIFSFTYAVGCLFYLPYRPYNEPGVGDGPLWTYAISAEFMFLVWASFAALRVYAISERDWRLAIIVFCLDMTPAIIDAYNYIAYPFWPCKTNCGSEVITNMLVGLMRASVIVGDLIVLVVTWSRTYRFRQFARSAQTPLPLSNLLLRDGTVYFMLMLIVNVISLVTFITSTNVDIPYIAYCVSSVSVARYLLDLQRFEYRHVRQATRETTVGQATFNVERDPNSHISDDDDDDSTLDDDGTRFIYELHSMAGPSVGGPEADERGKDAEKKEGKEIILVASI